jgi:hypothetical protein
VGEKRHSIGTDPEFFFRNLDTGVMVSAIPHVEGTKYAPKVLDCGATCQRDNVAVEFATVPAFDGKDFVQRIREAFSEILAYTPAGCEMVAIPSADFPPEELEHEEAQAFGCDPDMDAWKLVVNDPPCAIGLNFRSCGGHIHVGHVEGDGNEFLLEPMGKVHVVRMMDLVHGIISVVMDDSPEAIERRKLYGKAGCHRPTDYGVEYRTLSNFWLKDPDLARLMDSLTGDVLKIVRENRHEQLVETIGKDAIVNTINNGDVETAKALFDDHVKELLSEKSLAMLEVCMAKEEQPLVVAWGLEG